MNEENLKFLSLGILIGALLVFFVYKANYNGDTPDKRMIELRKPKPSKLRLLNDFYIQPLIDVEVKSKIQIAC
jgi:hypothetical protein